MTPHEDVVEVWDGQQSRLRRRDVVGLALLTIATSIYLSLLGLRKLWVLQAGTYDLVIYDQGIRSYSRFEAPGAISMGVRSGLGPDFTLLGDHFSPVLALLAPLYWIHDGPVTLVITQAVLLAAAAVPLWFTARRELGPVAAHLVAIAYSVSWPVLHAAAFDFHEVAFAPLLTAILFERFSAWRRGPGRAWQVAVAGVAVACVKEDMGLLLAGFGAAVLLTAVIPVGGTTPARRHVAVLGTGFVAGGLAWTALMVALIIPASGGRLGADWRYDQFGATPGQAALAMLGDPLATLGELVTPGIKVETLVMLAAVGVGVVVSPYLLAVVPLLAARLLADHPPWWFPMFHYDAFLVVPLLIAGVDGIARLARWSSPRSTRIVTTSWAVAAAVLALALVPRWSDAAVLSTAGWHRDPHAAAGARAAAAVPDGVLVEAPNAIGPQLTGRATVLLLDHTRHDAPWVVVDTTWRQFPFCSVEEQVQRVADLRRDGYDVVSESGGYVVLHDAASVPDLDSPAVRSPCR